MLGKVFSVLLAIALSTSIFGITSQVNAKESMQIVSNPQESMKIINKNFYLDANSFLHVLGEIENTKNDAFELVQVTVTLYDANDSAIATKAGFPLLNVITPGSKSPFHILFTDTKQSKNATRVDAVVSTSFVSSPKEKALEISSHNSFVDKEGDVHIAGEVRNSSGSNSSFTQVIATFYDGDGKVLAGTFAITNPDTIPAGEKASFDLTLIQKGLPKNIAKYSLIVQSDEYDNVKPVEGTNTSDLMQYQQNQQQSNVSVAMKIKKNLTLLAVKNEDETAVYALEIKSANSSIAFVKARGWDRQSIDANSVLLQTNDRPITNGQNLIVLLIFNDRPSALEWTAFDSGPKVLSSGVLTPKT